MIVSSSEFKTNIGRYLSLVSKEDIIITRNGKRIARLIAEEEDKVAIAKSLIGILPSTVTKEDAKEEKVKRYENLD
ncbi:type II toxin-antitoxin system Phd/YefM family antitoxin [Desulfallas sp. Bu1-1]|jgi:prevent-host-death family protein|uniref:type II toxin-antitoxin system Phd/YefM family antitoxin n=1 Tax=Desulfallas sp. Bu1-1 TaxID=2787620 RepID=UPI00189E4535|nr:type II toxin-antitoxin system prevent-host-death family antitoxin [Desulfallas sp. Bu1-1]MBF7083803.1 type II toxin-antitoxin system Phd/YefM family antitoxin [Desulfallas sp. Bu1-1]